MPAYRAPCRRCSWLTFLYERYCCVCGWDRWHGQHARVAGLWSEVTGQ